MTLIPLSSRRWYYPCGYSAAIWLVASAMALFPVARQALSLPTEAGLMAIAQSNVRTAFNRPILELGSEGADVSELQAALKLLGYYSGTVNGVFDTATAEAVLAFQAAAGLNPNGIVDARTWTRLFPTTLPDTTVEPCICASENTSNTSATASGDLPLLRLGMEGTAVFGVQQRLQALGFFSGKPDGVFDTDTQAAVEAMQQRYDLQADGVVGPVTWEVLMR